MRYRALIIDASRLVSALYEISVTTILVDTTLGQVSTVSLLFLIERVSTIISCDLRFGIWVFSLPQHICLLDFYRSSIHHDSVSIDFLLIHLF